MSRSLIDAGASGSVAIGGCCATTLEASRRVEVASGSGEDVKVVLVSDAPAGARVARMRRANTRARRCLQKLEGAREKSGQGYEPLTRYLRAGLVVLKTSPVPSGRSSTSPASTGLTAASARLFESGRALRALSASAARARRNWARGGVIMVSPSLRGLAGAMAVPVVNQLVPAAVEIIKEAVLPGQGHPAGELDARSVG